MGYLIHRAGRTPALDAGFDSGEWSGCRTLNVDVFRPEGSGHRPETRFRLQYDREGLYGLFSVRDRFVRCVARKFQDPVCRDSCVEFFVRPAHGRGYVNFEFSAAGVLLAQHVADCRRRPGTDDVRPLTEREAAGIRIYHSLPGRIEQELAQETCYELGFFLPFSIFAGTHGAPAPCRGRSGAGTSTSAATIRAIRTGHPGGRSGGSIFTNPTVLAIWSSNDEWNTLSGMELQNNGKVTEK